MSGKTFEGPEILLSLNNHKLASFMFTEADQRPKTPGVENKNFDSTAGSRRLKLVCVPFALQVSWGEIEGPKWMLCLQRIYITAEGSQLRKLRSSIA